MYEDEWYEDDDYYHENYGDYEYDEPPLTWRERLSQLLYRYRAWRLYSRLQRWFRRSDSPDDIPF